MTIYVRVNSLKNFNTEGITPKQFGYSLNDMGMNSGAISKYVKGSNPDFSDQIVSIHTENESVGFSILILHKSSTGQQRLAIVQVPLKAIQENAICHISTVMVKDRLSEPPTIDFDVHYDTKGKGAFKTQVNGNYDVNLVEKQNDSLFELINKGKKKTSGGGGRASKGKDTKKGKASTKAKATTTTSSSSTAAAKKRSASVDTSALPPQKTKVSAPQTRAKGKPAVKGKAPAKKKAAPKGKASIKDLFPDEGNSTNSDTDDEPKTNKPKIAPQQSQPTVTIKVKKTTTVTDKKGTVVQKSTKTTKKKKPSSRPKTLDGTENIAALMDDSDEEPKTMDYYTKPIVVPKKKVTKGKAKGKSGARTLDEDDMTPYTLDGDIGKMKTKSLKKSASKSSLKVNSKKPTRKSSSTNETPKNPVKPNDQNNGSNNINNNLGPITNAPFPTDLLQMFPPPFPKASELFAKYCL